VAVKVNHNEEIFVDVNITPMESTKKIIKSFSNISSGSSLFEGKEANIEDVSTDNGVKITKLKKLLLLMLAFQCNSQIIVLILLFFR